MIEVKTLTEFNGYLFYIENVDWICFYQFCISHAIEVYDYMVVDLYFSPESHIRIDTRNLTYEPDAYERLCRLLHKNGLLKKDMIECLKWLNEKR